MLFIFTLLYLCGHLTSHSFASLNLFLFCCGLGLQKTKVTRNVWKVSVGLIQFQCIHGFPSWLCVRVTYRAFPFINKYSGLIPADSYSGDFHIYFKESKVTMQISSLDTRSFWRNEILSSDSAVDFLRDWFPHRRFYEDCWVNIDELLESFSVKYNNIVLIQYCIYFIGHTNSLVIEWDRAGYFLIWKCIFFFILSK